MARKRLSPRHQAFLEAYLRTSNASEAARVAGFRGRPDVVGPRLLVSTGIREALAKHMRKAEEKVQLRAEDVLLALKRRLNMDPRQLVDENGNRLSLRELPEDVVKALDFELDKAGLRWKLARSQDIVSAARVLGMLKDHIELSGKIDLAERIREARQRFGHKG